MMKRETHEIECPVCKAKNAHEVRISTGPMIIGGVTETTFIGLVCGDCGVMFRKLDKPADGQIPPQQAYRKGRFDYQKHGAFAACPYTSGPMRHHWVQGMEDAERGEPDRYDDEAE